MIVRYPRSLVNFFLQFVPKDSRLAPAHVRQGLLSVVASVVLATEQHRSLTVVGRTVYAARRDKSTVSRLLRTRDFRSRDMHWEAVQRAVQVLAPKRGRGKEWLLALDGTALTRGAETKIKGAIQSEKRSGPAKKRKKGAPRRTGGRDSSSKTKKGRRTKYHTFLMASLTTHEGVRVPLPRYTCDPKGFHRQCGRPRSRRDTQIDLAKVLIKRTLAILPEGVKLVVVADSYFECNKLFLLAHVRNFVLITPTDSNRCFANQDTPSKSNGVCVQDRGLSFPMKTFSRLDLHRGNEKTACFRRHATRQAGPKDRRTYWLRHESRTVAKLGTVGVVYSWKTPVYEPRRNFRKKSFKILFCSDPTWPAERVVEYYECRWTAIEILFRELKQRLGLGDYTGQSLEALERWLDAVLMSFLYLEMERRRLVTDAESPKPLRERARTARTQGMQGVIHAEANRDLMSLMKMAHRSERKNRLLMGFLREISQTDDSSACAA